MSIIHRKEQLVLTAIDIIDDLGIQNLTTREIARRLNISEATLFRHYKNKNELLMAVLDYFVQFDRDIFQSIKLKDYKPTMALTYMLSSYAEFYENYPAVTTIIQVLGVFLYEEGLVDRVHEIQASRASKIYQMIEEAKDSGEIKTELESEMIGVLIIGFFKEICFIWKAGGCDFSLKDKINSTLTGFFHAFKKEIGDK